MSSTTSNNVDNIIKQHSLIPTIIGLRSIEDDAGGIKDVRVDFHGIVELDSIRGFVFGTMSRDSLMRFRNYISLIHQLSRHHVTRATWTICGWARAQECCNAKVESNFRSVPQGLRIGNWVHPSPFRHVTTNQADSNPWLPYGRTFKCSNRVCYGIRSF